MNILKRIKNYFTKTEIILWFSSSFLLLISFLLFDKENYLNLIASIIGITSLILNSKGNPFGQALMIIFSIVYGVISYSFKYYGEMITYLGMSGPMAVIALVAWVKNPYKEKKLEVKVSRINRNESVFMFILTAIVTFVFYFILKAFGTSSLLVSTISVTTSFIAVYLTFRRSPYFALAYALNDIVLIVLWAIASFFDTSYLSVVICFILFLACDLYCFICWIKMEKRQNKNDNIKN